MKSYKNKSISFNFPILSGNCIGFLLLFFSLNGTAQIHISENTLIHVSDNTIIFSNEGFTESTKKEIAKGVKHTQKISFSDSLIQVVKIKNKKHEQKIELAKVAAKKEPKSAPKETTTFSKEEESKLFSLVFKPFPNKSSDSFSSYGPSRIAFIRTHSPIKSNQAKIDKEYIDNQVLFYPEKKNILSSYLSNRPYSKLIVEEHTTRPPPIQIMMIS